MGVSTGFWSSVYPSVYQAQTDAARRSQTQTGTALKCLLHIPIARLKETDEEHMWYLQGLVLARAWRFKSSSGQNELLLSQ